MGVTNLASGRIRVSVEGPAGARQRELVSALAARATGAGGPPLVLLGEGDRLPRSALARAVADCLALRDGSRVDVSEEDPVRWHRSRIAAALLLLGALAALAALVDPHTGARAPRVVLALDRSASIDPSMRATEARWLAAVRAHSGSCPAPCGVVSFAGTANLIPASAGELAVRAGLRPGATATDLERGIGAAVAAAPEGGRVVALSDGDQTQGDATAAVAAARHITIDAEPLADLQLRDAALTRLDGPSAVRMGDTISLLVTVRSTVTAVATLGVRRDGGRAAAQTRVLQRGDDPLTLAYTATTPGWHSFTVAVQCTATRRRRTTRSPSTSTSARRRGVVVVPPARPGVAGILSARARGSTTLAPTSLPATAAGYAALDAWCSSDLPGERL